MFLTLADYQERISDSDLEQITEGNSTRRDSATKSAAGMIKEKLGGRYDVEPELAKTGTQRNEALRIWMLALACYFLYARIPDDQIPERIVKDYDDAMSDLDKIASGKIRTSLPEKTAEDGTVKRAFRMGSNEARSHNML